MTSTLSEAGTAVHAFIARSFPQLIENLTVGNHGFRVIPDSDEAVSTLAGNIDVRDEMPGADADMSEWMELDALRGGNFLFYTHEKTRGRLTTSDIGLVESLWDEFGGAVSDGRKILDKSVGTVFCDEVTPDEAAAVAGRLEAKGFASYNVIFSGEH